MIDYVINKMPVISQDPEFLIKVKKRFPEAYTILRVPYIGIEDFDGEDFVEFVVSFLMNYYNYFTDAERGGIDFFDFMSIESPEESNLWDTHLPEILERWSKETKDYFRNPRLIIGNAKPNYSLPLVFLRASVEFDSVVLGLRFQVPLKVKNSKYETDIPKNYLSELETAKILASDLGFNRFNATRWLVTSLEFQMPTGDEFAANAGRLEQIPISTIEAILESCLRTLSSYRGIIGVSLTEYQHEFTTDPILLQKFMALYKRYLTQLQLYEMARVI